MHIMGGIRFLILNLEVQQYQKNCLKNIKAVKCIDICKNKKYKIKKVLILLHFYYLFIIIYLLLICKFINKYIRNNILKH